MIHIGGSCERCGPYSAGHTSDKLYAAYDAAFNFSAQGDDTPAGSPSELRNQWIGVWEDMRIAMAGVKAVRKYAFDRDWIEPPESIEYMLHETRDASSAKKQLKYYIGRAQYPEIVSFARDITIGRIMRKDPVIEGVEQDGVTGQFALTSQCLESADDTGRSFSELTRFLLSEKFTTRRSAMYIYNAAEVGPVEAKIKVYTAENVWSWTSEGELTLAVFREQEIVADGKYSQKKQHIFRELCIENGVVVERIWRKGDSDKYISTDEQVLRIRGQALTRIPVVFDGGRNPESPPYMALFNKSIEAFQISAQLKHRLFRVHSSWLHLNYTDGGQIVDHSFDPDGLEKPDSEPTPLVPGLGALETENTQAQYLIDDGAGITHLRDELNDCKADMASLGARFGINYGASNVSTDTERMQQGGETAFITSHIHGTSEALTQAFKWKAELEGKPETAVRAILITLNSELTDEGLPFTLEQVISAYDGGLISGEIAFAHVRLVLPSIPAEATWEDVYGQILAEQSGIFDMPDEPDTDGSDDEDIDSEEE